MPSLTMTVTTEVVDDEEQHVVTAGAIITVTILLKRNINVYFYKLLKFLSLFLALTFNKFI